jgi:hypothetical protein
VVPPVVVLLGLVGEPPHPTANAALAAAIFAIASRRGIFVSNVVTPAALAALSYRPICTAQRRATTVPPIEVLTDDELVEISVDSLATARPLAD